MVEFNPDAAKPAVRTETVTVRNARSIYPNDQKPSVDTVLQDALSGGYDRMEISKYYSGDDKKNLPSIIETYYAKDGSVVAKRITQNGLPSEGTKSVFIDTPTATYNDWDNDGKVDSKDTDRTITIEVPEEDSKATQWETANSTSPFETTPLLCENVSNLENKPKPSPWNDIINHTNIGSISFEKAFNESLNPSLYEPMPLGKVGKPKDPTGFPGES